ncbi:acyl carrier protein [Pseudomonas sp. KFB-139]|uniref:Acyl carrier protein n=1 Tax=Pseudomonas serbiensis TaxID=3064350 RepID=A0ABT9CMX6_9PSED|nr:acyl carrier protein [Pseudomonas sp. KFB-138]MDO7926849.1 acyl carrier protein [Pseudomonas sp. KFB-138]
MHVTTLQMTQEINGILFGITEKDNFDKGSDLFEQGVNSLQMAILIDELNKIFNLGVSLEILAEGASIDAIVTSLNKKINLQKNG